MQNRAESQLIGNEPADRLGAAPRESWERGRDGPENKNMKKTTWTTYGISGFTCDVANDQASAGGVHIHQVRKTKAGWQYRVKQANGRHEACSAVEPISEADGEARFATASQ